MGPVARAVLQSWAFDPWPTLAVGLVGWIYLRGWRRLRCQVPRRFPVWRLAAFWGGLATLLVAIASPLDAFAGLLLQVHMSQHVLLMLVAPPLVWLGAPIAPLLRGLPPHGLKSWLGPFLAWPGLRRLARSLVHPAIALPVFVGTTWIWHAPALYEAALRSSFWHRLEHACFFGSALLFWWPVVRPWPSRVAWPRWALVPYLLLAHLQNTAFSALFTFSERVIYTTYEAVPRLAGTTALGDQAVAGAIMWVPGSLVLLAAVVLVLHELLEAPRLQPSRSEAGISAAPRAPKARASPLDLLRTRGAGAWLRRPQLRRVVQAVALVLAIAVVLDGLLGPSLAPLNLAGVVPWTWWRGLVVLGILVLGNVGCFACPFVLPRSLARRWRPAGRRWPRALRSKWLAVGGLLLYLFAYEAVAPWNRPALTAAIVLGYFVSALVVDAVFQGASFCKHLCPIGQFQFLGSTISPFEVKVRDPGRCASCTTHDCLRGNEQQQGCELELFQPAKAGNLDCTFCLDCVRACPHDNVGILRVTPGGDLARDGVRSSLGRLSRRPDLAVLALVFVFAAFANAAGMLAPTMHWEMRAAVALGASPGLVGGVGLLALLGASLAVAALAAGASRRLARLRAARSEILCRFALSLLPLGFCMWLAHLGFHLATGAAAIVPAAWRAVGDLGIALGPPPWELALPASLAPRLLSSQILVLGVGWLASLHLAWRIAADYAPRPRRQLAVCTPWLLLSGALYASGLWVLFQPMQMRGTLAP